MSPAHTPAHTTPHTQADSQLHQLTLWDVDTDTVKIFSPAALLDHTHPPENHTPQYTTLPPELPESAINEQHLQLRALINRDIVSIHWDSGDPRLLVLATGGKASGGNKAGKHTQVRGWLILYRCECVSPQASAVLVSLLVGQDVCVVISDVLPMKPTWKGETLLQWHNYYILFLCSYLIIILQALLESVFHSCI